MLSKPAMLPKLHKPEWSPLMRGFVPRNKFPEKTTSGKLPSPEAWPP